LNEKIEHAKIVIVTGKALIDACLEWWNFRKRNKSKYSAVLMWVKKLNNLAF